MAIKKTGKQEEAISRDRAKLVLENVFSACSVPPNSVPMEILEEDIRHNQFLNKFIRALIIISIIAILVVPITFSRAGVDYYIAAPMDDHVQVTVNVASILPVKNASFTLDGQPLQASRKGSQYSLTILENGTLRAEITTINNQTTVEQTEIRAFVEHAPIITSHDLVDGIFGFTLEKGSHPIDYASIYGLDEQGNIVSPSFWDEATGRVEFPNIRGTYNFFIPDTKGNVLQAILSPTS